MNGYPNFATALPGLSREAISELQRSSQFQRLAPLLDALASGPLDARQLLRILLSLCEGGGSQKSQPSAELRPALQALLIGDPLPALAAPLRNAKLEPLTRQLREALRPFPGIAEADGSPVDCIEREVFRNWGYTVENTPGYTFVPRTLIGICNIVRWATSSGKRVRAAGYRHTWGDLYSADDQVLISMLPLQQVEQLPSFSAHSGAAPGFDPGNQLQGIELLGSVVEGGIEKRLCRIAAGTTNEQFRRWCLYEQGGNLQWTIPLNVIMVEITWGGSNAPICHGAGWRNQTLSDLVAEIEFVNAHGELQTVSDPEQLKAAAGCFGLLGIVTALTLKLDPMSFAAMRPQQRPVQLTIPPPAGFRIPMPLQIPTTPTEREAAWNDFVHRCENDYYAEWFWFAYQPNCWINTWSNDGARAAASDYPPPSEVTLQEVGEYIGELLNESAWFKSLPGQVQGWILGAAAMAQLPDIADDQPAIVTPLIDGLHFRRGIQNMRVRDMELEIPIPPRADDPSKPDWSVCQRAWWNAIAAVYRHPEGPMRIALEMRVMGGSGIDLAPQGGNRFGTCSIEVLSNLNVDDADWQAFMQEVADAWMAEVGPDGCPLNVRTHWAKQWQGLTFRGVPAVDYLRDTAYRDSLPLFSSHLQAAATAGGASLADLLRVFGNPLLEQLFGPVFNKTES